MFLYCATRSSLHFPVQLFTVSALNGFIIIIITKKNLMFIHAFLFSLYDLLRILMS